MTDNIDWKISKNLVEYDLAILEMNKRITKIKQKSAKELVWLLEHNSVFTAGTSAKKEDLKNDKVLIRYSGRGGQWTWHGPGQRVVYIMLDLSNRLKDVKAYVYALEEIIIKTLADYSVEGVRIKNQPGVWVKNKNKYDKIGALGIRISGWITFHGLSINVNPNLNHFKNIVPCGVKDGGVTSFHKLGKKITLEDLDVNLQKNFKNIFSNNGLFRIK